MPATAAITPDLIRAAAEQLRAAASKVTTETVRAALMASTGVGGSHSTINPVLAALKREWREQDSRVADVQTAVPAALSAVQERMLREVWTVAVRESDGRFEAERARHAADLQQVEAEQSEALALADQLQSRLDSSVLLCGQLQQQLDQQRQANTLLQAEVVKLAEVASAGDARNQELHERLDERTREASDLRSRVDLQASEIAQTRAQLQAERELADSQKTELVTAVSDKQQLIQRVAEVETQARYDQSELERMRVALSEVREQQVSRQQMEVELRTALQAANESAAQAREAAAELRGEVKTLKAALEGAR